MGLKPCSSCRQRPFGKPVGMYVSWFVDEERVSYRLTLCASCAPQVAELVKSASPIVNDDQAQTWPEACGLCHSAMGDDLDPSFVTVFQPRLDPISLVVATCGPCATNWRQTFRDVGVLQADRNPGVGVGGSRGTGGVATTPQPLAWA